MSTENAVIENEGIGTHQGHASVHWQLVKFKTPKYSFENRWSRENLLEFTGVLLADSLSGKPQRKEVAAFLEWILGEGQQFLPATGYINLPDSDVKAQLEKLK